MKKLTQEQMGRLSVEEFRAMEKVPVVAVLDNVRSAGNVGAFFRTADAFGIGELALCGITARPPQKEIHKTALGAELTVAWRGFENTLQAVTNAISSVLQSAQMQTDLYAVCWLWAVSGVCWLTPLQHGLLKVCATMWKNSCAHLLRLKKAFLLGVTVRVMAIFHLHSNRIFWHF